MRASAQARSLRQRLSAGETAVGTMIFEFNTIGLPRIVADAGADFVLVDLEHTGWGIGGIRPLLATARADLVPYIVRVHFADRYTVSTVLDAGAAGVMVAMINDADQATYVVDAARFPPSGRRGFGFVYPDQLTHGASAAIDMANAETVVILQVESSSGVDEAAAIATTSGVDVIWVGEFDLSLSLGIPGDLDHRLVQEAEQRVLRACNDAGIAAGVLVGDTETARAKLDAGFRMIALGTDIGLYSSALKRGLADVRGHAGAD